MKLTLHAYPDYVASEDDSRRIAVARESWSNAYCRQFQALPCSDFELPRSFRDGERSLFYVIDLIQTAISMEAEYILLSNTDVGLMKGAAIRLREMAAWGISFWSNRLDYDGPLICPPREEMGQRFIGTDLFGFSLSIAVSLIEKFPDMLIGAEAWDSTLRHFLQTKCGGTESKGLVFHERHQSIWLQPKNIKTLPSQIHNLKLAHEYFTGLPKPDGMTTV